ncbi:hypothetical protein FRC00_013246 [Tulasnella sp. 408]|nr:hypothetical protein FRC00_013246 [Tulasnella sp. 408]
MVFQDTSESLYVGIKNGNVVAVAAPNEGVTVRHDRVTKELRIFQRSTNGETGEKLEIRLPPWSYMVSSSSAVVRMATLQLLSARGYPKGQDPIRNGESFTSWNVADDGVLEAIPRNGSAYPIHPYLRSRDANTNYPLIRAHMDDPSDPVTSSMRFLTLRLEEV